MLWTTQAPSLTSARLMAHHACKIIIYYYHSYSQSICTTWSYDAACSCAPSLDDDDDEITKMGDPFVATTTIPEQVVRGKVDPPMTGNVWTFLDNDLGPKKPRGRDPSIVQSSFDSDEERVDETLFKNDDESSILHVSTLTLLLLPPPMTLASNGTQLPATKKIYPFPVQTTKRFLSQCRRAFGKWFASRKRKIMTKTMHLPPFRNDNTAARSIATTTTTTESMTHENSFGTTSPELWN